MDRLSLMDVQKRMTGDSSSTMKVAEILSKTMPLLADAVWVPTNKTDTRTTLVRTGLPKAFVRRANQGTMIGKSTVVPNEEATCTYEIYAENDVRVINSFGDQRRNARATESRAYIESVGQSACTTAWYGNKAADPDLIDGLAVRYDALTGQTYSQNVLDGGAPASSSDCASMYLIQWDENKVAMTYPKHAQNESHGIVEHDDEGLITTNFGTDATRRLMPVYRDRFSISYGWTVSDWRCIARTKFLSTGQLATQAVEQNPAMVQSKLRFFMIQMMYRMPQLGGKLCFYMNRTLAQYLDIESLRSVGNAGMTYKDVQGMPVLHFRGVPIRIDDSLLNNETRV